jgi:hypothetical protein
MVLLLGLAVPVRANVLESFGFGAEAVASGNARTAWGTGYTATFYNPALLALSRAVNVGGGYQVAAPQVSIDRSLPVCSAAAAECAAQFPGGYSPYASYRPDPAHGFSAGFTVPVDLEPLGDGAIGVAFYFPSDNFVKAQSINLEFPHYLLYQYNMNRLAFDLALSLKPFRWLSAGLGVQILTDVHGWEHLGLDVRNNGFYRQDVRVEAHPKVGTVAGLAILPAEGWTVGASFRDQLNLGFYLPSRMTFDEAATLNMYYSLVSAYSPRRVNLGVAHAFANGANLSAQGSWAQWSAMPIPSPPTYIDVTGTVIEGTGLHDTLDLDSKESWQSGQIRDQWSVALGGDWPVTPWLALNAGYSFLPAVTGDESGPYNYLDNDLHQLGYGVRLRAWLPEPFGFTLEGTLAGSTGLMPTRTIRKADPRDATGDYSHGGWVQAFAVSISVTYEPAPAPPATAD